LLDKMLLVQRHFTIAELANDWHELTVSYHSAYCSHSLLKLKDSASCRHTTAPNSHTVDLDFKCSFKTLLYEWMAVGAR